MEFPPLMIEREGDDYILVRLERSVSCDEGRFTWGDKWEAVYESEYNIPNVEITYEWQDESRTWLTIDEVHETLWDCQIARREAA